MITAEIRRPVQRADKRSQVAREPGHGPEGGLTIGCFRSSTRLSGSATTLYSVSDNHTARCVNEGATHIAYRIAGVPGGTPAA